MNSRDRNFTRGKIASRLCASRMRSRSKASIVTKQALRRDELHTITDKSYLSGRKIFECHEA